MFSGNLREDYRVLHELEKEHRELGRTEQEIAMRAIVKSIKERIRNTIREQLEEEENSDTWHYTDYDSRWCKTVFTTLPEEWYDDMSREEAIKAYKEDVWWHWYNPYNDGRDCTGVWFTSFIYVCPIPALGRTIVYHMQDCDV